MLLPEFGMQLMVYISVGHRDFFALSYLCISAITHSWFPCVHYSSACVGVCMHMIYIYITAKKYG